MRYACAPRTQPTVPPVPSFYQRSTCFTTRVEVDDYLTGFRLDKTTGQVTLLNSVDTGIGIQRTPLPTARDATC